MKRFLFTLCLFTFLPLPLLAADYSVSPLIIEHTIEPRDIFEESVKVTNSTNHTLRIFPTVNEVTIGSDGTIKTFVPASMSDTRISVTSWIAVTRGRVEIKAGETVKIPITITVNPMAEPGEYYALVGFADGTNQDQAIASVMAGTAPGTIVRLELKDKKNEYLRLNRFYIKRFIITEQSANSSYELENTGDIPILPTGEIVFYNLRGVEIATSSVNIENVTLDPGTKMTFNLPLPPEVHHLGKYKAFLSIDYGKNQRITLTDTAFFSVVSLLPLLAIFLTILLVSSVMALYYHGRRFKNNDENGESIPLYVRTSVNSVEQQHDINLKKQ